MSSPAATNQTPSETGTPRAGLARDLYALIEFYLKHPEHPMPTSIEVMHELPNPAAVDRWAAQHGAHAFTRPASGRRHATVSLDGGVVIVDLIVLAKP